MAVQVINKTVDDLDGGDDAKTVQFGVDGKQYEIDLCEENHARLINDLSPFLAAARKVKRG